MSPALVPNHRPEISKIYDIANYLGVNPEIIWSIRRFKNRYYRSFTFKKRSGGSREIDAPRTFLKVIQWWLLDSVLENSNIPTYVFGFVKGRSFIDNAREHVGCKYVLNVDIKDFFGSITVAQVERVFLYLGYSAEVARGLADLTTFNGRLPQGAPTSPMLANLVFSECDTKLKGLAEKYDLKYTRYADDLTFSSGKWIDDVVVEAVADAISGSGFLLNKKKTKFMGPGQSREVTGLIVGENEVSLSRDYLNSARGWFFSLLTKPDQHKDSVGRLRGTIELIKQVGGRGSVQLLELGAQAMERLLQAQQVSPTTEF